MATTNEAHVEEDQIEISAQDVIGELLNKLANSELENAQSRALIRKQQETLRDLEDRIPKADKA